MSAHRQRDLGYEFTPTTRTAIRALPDGRLDVWDYAILAAIYDRDVPRNLRVRFTLDQLADWIGWTRTPDALSKRLRRLRDGGWLSYEQPTKPPYRYEATLIPEPPSRSEVGPRSNPASQAAADNPGDASGPSRGASSPSRDAAANVAAEPSEGQCCNGPGPSLPEGPEKTSLGEEDLELDGPTYTSRAREDDDPPEVAAQYDEFFAATTPKRERGYGWEPDS